MHSGRYYRLLESIYWTRRDVYVLVLIGTIPTILYQVFNWHWLAIPWLPVTLVGTAAAFLVGFRNTQTYNRLWEARQIWGAIVNTSRSWGMLVKACVHNDEGAHRELLYRHCGWLTALRHQLREPRSWESMEKPRNREFRQGFSVPEYQIALGDDLKPYLSPAEWSYIMDKKNRATQLLVRQSEHLARLQKEGRIDPLNFVELERLLIDLYEQQGKCERIKNFPYPRQFASVNLYFVWLLVILLPFGMLNEFRSFGEHFTWLTIPFTVIVGWVFTMLESIGVATENPFEGGPNDVPISALSRTIEIDLRDMMDETDLPQPLVAVNKILM
jgi:putative membrane protein